MPTIPLDGATVRSPSDHRAIVARWRLRAPANDSDVAPRDRAAKGRHADMTDIAPALRTWRELSHLPEPLSTNWLASAANDNATEERTDPYEDEWRDAPPPPSIDSAMEIRPRPEEILRAIGDVEIAHSESDGPAIPVGGDIDLHDGAIPAVIGGTPCAPLARIGKLRFGNGDTCELALLRTAGGGLKKKLNRVPRGALTHCGPFPARDRLTAWRGAEDGKIDARTLDTGVTIDERIDAERLVTRLRQELSQDDIAVLDKALDAKNFADVGRLHGHRGKHAERQGKALLRAAGERLQNLLQAA